MELYKTQDKEKAKSNGKADDRSHHPAILAVRDLHSKKHYPPLEVYDRLIECIGENPDVERLRKNRAIWVERGYNKQSYVWATEWYVRGIPDPRKDYNNGRPQTGATPARGKYDNR